MEDVASAVPLCLTGGTFAVYLQLPEKDRKMFSEVKQVLVAVFAVNPFLAYEQFTARKLHSGESPDVFLAELRCLASLFGKMTDKGLSCAFVAGLPKSVWQLLRAGSRMESLDLDQSLVRARAVIQDDSSLTMGDVCLGARETTSRWQQAVVGNQRYYECNGPNHFAQDCLLHRHDSTTGGWNQ